MKGCKGSVTRDAMWVLSLSLVRSLTTHPGHCTTISQYMDVKNASQVIHKNITTKLDLILDNYISFFAFHEEIKHLHSQISEFFMLHATAIQKRKKHKFSLLIFPDCSRVLSH